MCDYDYTHLSTLHVRARKEHRCTGCYSPITVGTVHVVSVGVVERSVHRYREHIECREAAAELHPGECYTEGWLLEDASQDGGPPPDWMTGAARDAWLDVGKEP